MSSLGLYFNNSEPLVYKGDPKWVLDTCVTGIEIEIENLRARNHQPPHQADVVYEIGGMWALVSDGSLRNNGGEYISRKLFGKDLTTGLDVISKHIFTAEPKHVFSHRCSVHIHMDVRDLNINQFQKLIQLYCIFEKPLFNISGDRSENEYCIPLWASMDAKRCYGMLASDKGKYAKYFSTYNVDNRDTWREIGRQIQESYVKYMALNIIPFVSKGSIEFRHHEGTIDIERISRWINILFSLKKACIEYPFKNDPYVQLSEMGPMALLEMVFGKYSKDLYYDGIELDLWQGCRVAQDMVLSFDLGSVHAKLCKGELYKNIISSLGDSPPKELGGPQQPAASWMANARMAFENMYQPEIVGGNYTTDGIHPRRRIPTHAPRRAGAQEYLLDLQRDREHAEFQVRHTRFGNNADNWVVVDDVEERE